MFSIEIGNVIFTFDVTSKLKRDVRSEAIYQNSFLLLSNSNLSRRIVGARLVWGSREKGKRSKISDLSKLITHVLEQPIRVLAMQLLKLSMTSAAGLRK